MNLDGAPLGTVLRATSHVRLSPHSPQKARNHAIGNVRPHVIP